MYEIQFVIQTFNCHSQSNVVNEGSNCNLPQNFICHAKNHHHFKFSLKYFYCAYAANRKLKYRWIDELKFLPSIFPKKITWLHLSKWNSNFIRITVQIYVGKKFFVSLALRSILFYSHKSSWAEVYWEVVLAKQSDRMTEEEVVKIIKMLSIIDLEL